MVRVFPPHQRSSFSFARPLAVALSSPMTAHKPLVQVLLFFGSHIVAISLSARILVVIAVIQDIHSNFCSIYYIAYYLLIFKFQFSIVKYSNTDI